MHTIAVAVTPTNNLYAYSPEVLLDYGYTSKATTAALYAEDGRLFSAASTGMMIARRLHLSQVFDPHMLICAPCGGE